MTLTNPVKTIGLRTTHLIVSGDLLLTLNTPDKQILSFTQVLAALLPVTSTTGYFAIPVS
jgi:hypothetical protein